MSKLFIKNYTINKIESIFESLGEPKYRAKQLFTWLYEKNIDSFDEMTNFSKNLRSKLDEKYVVSAFMLDDHRISQQDQTEKFLFKTHDGHYIESVLIKNEVNDEGRLTVCISSQVGCAMGCVFCETAKIGFIRNLEVAEILDQLNQVRRLSGLKNTNIVFMGMGEPFNNYDTVLKAADIMNYTFGFHISTRKITISTSGIKDKIEQFIDEKRPYNLALSLNDTQFDKRKKHMPVENKYPFKEIIDMLEVKFPVSRNRLTIEYVMRSDNIAREDAKRLKKMFKYTNRMKLNLIPLNTGKHSFGVPSEEDIEQFVRELEIMNVPVSIRKSAGKDIGGACGQLSGVKYCDD